MAEKSTPSVAELLQTPEAQAAIMAAAAEAAAKAVAALKPNGDAVAVAGDDAASLMKTLAMHIAELSDQGTQRKRVAPEVLRQRAEARAEAEGLIVECRKHLKVAREIAKSEPTRAEALRAEWMPEYRLKTKVYFGERLVEPYRRDPVTKQAVPTEVFWTGMPNDGMAPVNAIAKRICALYKASVGSVDKFNGLDTRPYMVTQAGLVIKTGTAQDRLLVDTKSIAPEEPEDDLIVKDNSDPTAPFIQVLGSTPAGRARQNYLDKPAAA